MTTTSTDFWMKEGDLLPVLDATLTDEDGVAFDLSSASGVQVRIQFPDDTVVTRDCSIIDAMTGRIRYTWQSGDTDIPGLLDLEFVATIGGKTITFPSSGYTRIQIVGALD